MSQKKVTITLKKLDVTQLYKIRDYLGPLSRNRSSLQGCYLAELTELVDSILSAADNNEKEIVAPDLTI